MNEKYPPHISKRAKQIYNNISNIFKIQKNNFNQTLIRKILNNIDQLIINGQIQFKLKDYLKTEKAIERFVKQFSGHTHIDIYEEQVTLSKSVTAMFIKKNILLQQDINEVPYNNEDREKGEKELKNIYTLEEFFEKYDKNLIETDEEKETIERYKQLLKKTYTNEDVTQYYIISEDVEIEDIYTLNNREIEYKILPNPTIKRKTFTEDTLGEIFKQKYSDEIIKIRVKISKRLSNDDESGLILATKYQYTCPAPNCKKIFTKEPYELAGDIKHECGIVDGKKIKTTVDKNSYSIANQINLFIYEVSLPELKDHGGKTIFIYSQEHNIKTGTYEVELKREYLALEKRHTKRHRMFFLLNKKEIIPKKKDDLDLIKDDVGKELCKQLNIPHIKLMDILQSIRDIHKIYGKELINNKGMWIQIATTIQGLAVQLFKHNKFVVNTISNLSLSKTYPAWRIAVMFDDNFHYQESTETVSLAGWMGGINTAKMINGVVSRVFEEGMISKYGITLFDEASSFFDNPQWTKLFKSFLSEHMSIEKNGAEGIRMLQKYTPILLSNFNPKHDHEYKDAVMKQYVELIKESGNMINNIDKRKTFIGLNYYLQIHDYETVFNNILLATAFKLVRENYFDIGINWRTGVELAMSGRMLMDVTVENKKKSGQIKIQKKEDIVRKKTSAIGPNMDIIPKEQFLLELNEKYGNEKINLLVESHISDKKTEQQIDQLGLNITQWLYGTLEGVNILSSLGEGRMIDDKIEDLLGPLIMTVQLVENIDSVTLDDNVKEWVKIFLLKCKKGLSEDEYNYIDNKTEYIPDTIDIGGIDFQLEQQRKKDRDKRAVREEIYQEQQEQKDKNNVKEFTEEGETYEENSEDDLELLAEAIE